MVFLKKHIEDYQNNDVFSDISPYLLRLTKLAGIYSLYLKRDLQYKTPIKECEDKGCAVNTVLLPADLMMERFIINHLSHDFPDTPIVSEEGMTGNLINITPNDNTFFCVDPLDGSYCFANNEQNFSIQIGLIAKGEPVFGISHYPLLNKTYIGHYGAHSLILEHNQKNVFSTYNRHDIPDVELKACISNASADREPIVNFLKKLGIQKYDITRGCPNLCNVNEGKCDVFPIFHSNFEWDTAAYDAILRYANEDGKRCLFTINGEPVKYGKSYADIPFKNPKLIITPNTNIQEKIKSSLLNNYKSLIKGRS